MYIELVEFEVCRGLAWSYECLHFLVFCKIQSEIESNDSLIVQMSLHSDYEDKENSREACLAKGTKRRFANIKQKWTRIDVLRKKTFRASIWVVIDHFKITLPNLRNNPVKKITLLLNKLKNEIQISGEATFESNEQFLKIYFFLAKKLLHSKFKSTMTR